MVSTILIVVLIVHGKLSLAIPLAAMFMTLSGVSFWTLVRWKHGSSLYKSSWVAYLHLHLAFGLLICIFLMDEIDPVICYTVYSLLTIPLYFGFYAILKRRYVRIRKPFDFFIIESGIAIAFIPLAFGSITKHPFFRSFEFRLAFLVFWLIAGSFAVADAWLSDQLSKAIEKPYWTKDMKRWM